MKGPLHTLEEQNQRAIVTFDIGSEFWIIAFFGAILQQRLILVIKIKEPVNTEELKPWSNRKRNDSKRRDIYC